VSAPARDPAPARRAVLRWAVRLFRREWRQQLLLLVLATVTVGGAVTGSAVLVGAASTGDGLVGDASALIRFEDLAPAEAAAGIAAARERYGEVDVVAHSSTTVPGAVRRLEVRDVDPAGHHTGSLLDLLDGRYPTGASEVALTEGAADLYRAGIGDDVVVDRTTRRVVGVVENPSALQMDFVLVAPGTIAAPEWWGVLADGVGGPGELPVPADVLHAGGDSRRAIEAAVLAAVSVVMALVGLVAAAGFLVVAQRRQRQLGLLAAIGGTDEQVRLVMVANGVIVGVIAAVLGVGLGLGGWLLAAPATEAAADHRISRSDLPWGVIAFDAVLAVAAATVAAWWPARAAARLPVVAALSGRPAPPRPVHRSVLLALGFAVAGVAAIARSHPQSEDVEPLLLLGGVLAVVAGAVLGAPAAVRALGGLARRLPFAPRLALRDLARYQARAAAALAAITLSLSIAVAVVVVSTASEPGAEEGNLGDHQLLVLGDAGGARDRDPTAAEVADLDARAAQVVAALGDGVASAPLDVAFSPTTGGDPVAVGRIEDPRSIELLGVVHVATPEVLALYGIDPASIDPGTDLLTSRRSRDLLFLTPGRPPPEHAEGVPTERVDLPTHADAPNTLLTQAAIEREGLVTRRMGWIVESDDPLTDAQVDAARAAAAATGLVVDAREIADGGAALRTGATAIGALLSLAIAAMAVGLIRAEAARDIRTLTATGAAPRTRRAVTASTAAGLVLPGVLLGTAGAYVALLAVYRDHLDELRPIPVDHLLVLGIGLPLAATAAGWLLAGREPRGVARQALE
jgi:putative ABC transport system permease protein